MTGDASVRVKNDDPRLKGELKELANKNKPLYDMLFDLAVWIKDNFKKDTVVTGIYRTDAEQAEIYKNDPRYKLKPFKSPHQFWQAFDLRDSIYTKDEIKKTVDYVNKTYNKHNQLAFTAMDHNVGKGFHFHIQLVEKKA